MQRPLTDLCSSSVLHERDVQWTVKQWQLTKVTKQSIRSNFFTLHAGGCYLLFHSSPSSRRLTIMLSDCSEHKAATVQPTICKSDGTRYGLELTSDGTAVVDRSLMYTYDFDVYERILDSSSTDLVLFIKFTYVVSTNEANINMSRFCIIEKLQKAILADYEGINKNRDSLLQQNDVTFVIGNSQIRAHALLLSAASSVFLTMFSRENVNENNKRIVNLTNDKDVTPENFQTFLDILYGRQDIQHTKIELVTEVCVLARKYGIKELVESCGLVLSRTLQNENAIKLLLFAEKYQSEYLKRKASEHVKINMNALKQSQDIHDLYYTQIKRFY